jgi:UDP-N-acetylmuramate--alanine ligase
MSGIAELLANLGFAVSGSDAKASAVTARLAGLGVDVHAGHAAANVGDADVVVVSSAVAAANAEVVEAHRRGIPVIPRAEMLAELMRLRFSIAVAGSHGKTTTTSMIAFVLERAGLDPTAVIGGRLSVFGSNARLGRGEYMVAEADESDRSFLTLLPSIAVMTNVDHEHMESYGSFGDLQAAFVDFGNKVPFYGAVVACADDPQLMPVLPRLRRPVITYGLDNVNAQIAGTEVELGTFGARCTVIRRPPVTEPSAAAAQDETLGALQLKVPGRHNLQNALAAVAVATELGVPFTQISAALAEFQGAERRFEQHGEVNGVLVIDDYGHHPTEIAAVLTAAKVTLKRRLIVVFQPHRYTRTYQLMGEFGPALKEADEIVLTDIYAAGETAIPGVTLEVLADAVRKGSRRPVRVARTLDDVVATVATLAKQGDAVITLGAGSIGTVPARLLSALGGGGRA